jgi:xanthine dehydrogenase YagR molybdenum-binding subunit
LFLAGGELRSPEGMAEPLEQSVKRITHGALEAYAENIPDELPPESMEKLFTTVPPILRGSGRKSITAYGFGAQFAEVRVHHLTREIRVPRMVGAFACGRIVNPLTAFSQFMGGMIWGLGCALEEETEIDPGHARYVNDNIAEYHVAVNADVGQVDVIMVPEKDDQVNPLGIKGIGEIGIVGMNAAIANAVHHATGTRVRKLPIRIEDLLA